MKKVYGGSTPIKKVYSGSSLVYTSSDTVFNNNVRAESSVSSWVCAAYGTVDNVTAWGTTTINTGSTGSIIRYNGNVSSNTGLESSNLFLHTNHSSIGYGPMYIRSGSMIDLSNFENLSVSYTHDGTNTGIVPIFGLSRDSSLSFTASYPTLTAQGAFATYTTTSITNVSSISGSYYLYFVFIGQAAEYADEWYRITNIVLT